MTSGFSGQRPKTDGAGTGDYISGGVALAGVWLVLGGSLSILLGIAGVAHDSPFGTPGSYEYRFDATAWGWISLVIGVVLGLAGVSVLAGWPWGRLVGVAAAMASLITQFMFIPYYPWWSITVMALDLLAVWTLIRLGTP
jgi:hypothetical protein